MTASSEIPPAIQETLKSLPNRPGVYRMLNGDGVVIYVGKATSLKKRVNSYFHKKHPDVKTAALVSHIARIETTVTHTENEALILENNLIKVSREKFLEKIADQDVSQLIVNLTDLTDEELIKLHDEAEGEGTI